MKTSRKLIVIFSILTFSQILHGQEYFRKNAIIAESNLFFSSSISYSRTIAGDKANLFVGGGYVVGSNFGSGSHWLNVEAGLLFFGQKHYMEAGPMLMIGLNDATYPGFKLAYRFQGIKGFVFRPALSIYFPEYPYYAPSIGLGYAF